MENSILKFRELYGKFESLMRKKYKLEKKEKVYYYFIKLPEYEYLRKDMEIIKDIRNWITHNEYKINGEDSIQIKNSTIEYLKKVINAIENPPLVKNKYISKITSFFLNSNIVNVIEEMNKKCISHVPILDDKGYLIGVFSENTIFSKLSEEEIIGVESETTINDFKKYIKIDNHSSEYFDFISINSKLYKAQKMFANSINNNKKLAVLFVTENGKKDEKILGLLTPWDFL